MNIGASTLSEFSTRKAVAFDSIEELVKPDPQHFPAGATVLGKVPTEACERVQGLGGGRCRPQPDVLRDLPEHVEFIGFEDRAGRDSRICRDGAEREQPPREWGQDAQRIQKRGAALELSLLVTAAGLQRFEVFLDRPPRAVMVHDVPNVGSL